MALIPWTLENPAATACPYLDGHSSPFVLIFPIPGRRVAFTGPPARPQSEHSPSRPALLVPPGSTFTAPPLPLPPSLDPRERTQPVSQSPLPCSQTSGGSPSAASSNEMQSWPSLFLRYLLPPPWQTWVSFLTSLPPATRTGDPEEQGPVTLFSRRPGAFLPLLGVRGAARPHTPEGQRASLAALLAT